MDQFSRRTFIKGLGVGTALLVVPPWTRKALAGESLRGFTREDVVGGLTRSQIQDVLDAALSRSGNFADLYLETRTRTHIVIASSEIRTLEYGVIQGGGVRTVAGERTGYAYAETFEPDQLVDAARSAARIASAGGCIERGPLEMKEFTRNVTCQEPIEGVSIGDKVALLERVDRAARAVTPHIQQVVIDYSDATQRFSVATSSGDLVTDELPVIYLRVNVNASRNGATSEGMYRLSARKGMELLAGDAPEASGRAAAEQAVRMLEAQPAPSGELPVVIAAGGGVMFHEAVGHGLEADAVLRDATVFAGRVGEKVATELVSIYDDGSLPGERGSFNVDDEATPASKTLLIDKGILRGYMQDRRTAYNMREKSTGNGRRQSFRYPPIVRMTNTYLAPGKDSPEAIIRDTKRGIYAVNFGGGEVDPASGQFTFGLREAYLIEDGRVTAPIKGANLVGSGPEVLKRIDRVASDFGGWPGTCGKSDQWVPVTSGCPTLRVSAITVGGTA